VGTFYTRSLAVTSFGDRWLVVSFATWSHDETISSTVANFINADGSVPAPFVVYGPYSMGGNGIVEVAAASDGNTALVLQSTEITSGVETDLIRLLINTASACWSQRQV
jgi:hypothetical protein